MSNASKYRKKAVEFEQLKQFDRAVASYVRAIEENENANEDVDVALFNKVGDLTLRQGRVSEAVTYYERAVEHYVSNSLYDNAIALCNKILRNAPGRSNVYFSLGRICARKGLRSDATRNFLEYATRMQQEGRVDEGMRALAEVAELMPELTEVGRLVEEYAARAGITLTRRRTTPARTDAQVEGSEPSRLFGLSKNLVFLEIDYEAVRPLRGRTPAPLRTVNADEALPNETAVPATRRSAPSAAVPVPAAPQTSRLEDLIIFDPRASELDDILPMLTEETSVVDGTSILSPYATLDAPVESLGDLESMDIATPHDVVSPTFVVDLVASVDGDAQTDGLVNVDTVHGIVAGPDVLSISFPAAEAVADPVADTDTVAGVVEDRVADTNADTVAAADTAADIPAAGDTLPDTSADTCLADSPPAVVLEDSLLSVQDADADTPEATIGGDEEASLSAEALPEDSPSDASTDGHGETIEGAVSVDDQNDVTPVLEFLVHVDELACTATEVETPEDVSLEWLAPDTLPDFVIVEAEQARLRALPALPLQDLVIEGNADDVTTDANDPKPVAVPDVIAGGSDDISCDASYDVAYDVSGAAMHDTTTDGASCAASPIDFDAMLAPGGADDQQTVWNDPPMDAAELQWVAVDGDAFEYNEPDSEFPDDAVVELDSLVIDHAEPAALASLAVDTTDAQETGELHDEFESIDTLPPLRVLTLIELDAIVLDAVALGAGAPDAVDLGAVGLHAPDLDSIALDRISLDGVDLDSIVPDAVDLDAIDLDPVALDTVHLDALDLEMRRDAVAEQDGPGDDLDDLFGDTAKPAAVAAAEASLVASSRVRDLKRTSAASPQDFVLRRRLAEALFELGDRDEAIEELGAALDLAELAGAMSEAADIADERVRVAGEHIAHHQKRLELTIRLRDQARLRDAYLDLGDALVLRGDELRARAVYARVLEIDPWDDRALTALGDAAPPPPPKPPEAGSDDGSVSLADWLRDDDAPVSTRLRMKEPDISGDEQDDFNALLRHFKEGVARSLGEDDYESHYDLGVAYKEMGLLDDAIGEFQMALRSRSNRLAAYEALGQCFLEQQNYKVAITVLSRALHEPGVQDEQRVGVLYLLGYSCEVLQRFDEARGYFQRVYATDIHFRDVAKRLADLERTMR